MMRRHMIGAFWCAASAAALWAVAPARATEYFVSKAGKDAADGRSELNAFGTISKGASVLKPGDTLTVLPGHYAETVTVRTSGTPEAPTTIRAKYPGTALLRGDVDVSGFRLAAGTRYTWWVDFDRTVEGVTDRSGLRLYNPVSTVAETEQTPASFYQDPRTNRLYVHTADSAPADWKALTASVTNGFGIYLPDHAHDVVLDGLSFTGYNAREIPAGPGSRNRWGLFVDWGSERIVVRRCTAHLNSGGICMVGPSDAVVEDCHTFANVARFTGGLGANIIAYSGHNTTLRRNVVEEGDITFYGGDRADKKPLSGLMEHNLCIDCGIFIKGGFSKETTLDRNNCVIRGAFFRFPVDPSNTHLQDNEGAAALKTYADPIGHDYRLQSDAPNRGKGPNGADPGAFPYRDEVFFVSPKGDDAKAGTSLSLAWKTLNHAAQAAKPGQTVYVLEGVYNESLVPANSGTAEQPIRFLRRGRDPVVLDGGGKLPVGADLSGRSHILLRGLAIRNFTGNGVVARDGEGVGIERTIITACGGTGVAVSGMKDVTLSRCLLRENRAGGLSLERCGFTDVRGNIFDSNGDVGLRCDEDSLRGICSDTNVFVPGGQPAAALAGKAASTLTDWRTASGQDMNSLSIHPGYCDAAGGDFALREDSLLIGRGPEGYPVGPYMRAPVKTPVQVEDLVARAVTATTAVIECWTPAARSAIALEWDGREQIESPVRLADMPFSPGIFHSVGLAGLEPGRKHTVRVKAKAVWEGHQWTPYAATGTAALDAAPVAATAFETLAKDTPARELHVAVTGNDHNSGLSPKEAWRTLSHAAVAARPGDTVLVHEGAYNEDVFVRVTGDKDRPVTFRAAPGEMVWVEGNHLLRSTAFRLEEKHYVQIDGFHFRHFGYLPHIGGCIRIGGGSGHTIRRCFYDGRERTEMMDIFLRAVNTADLLVENCVMIDGFGPGVALARCSNANVRHCVFYNNWVYAADVQDWVIERDLRNSAAFSHNLFCDSIPTKVRNPFFRISHLDSLHSECNGYFARKGPAERTVAQTFFFRGKSLGPGDGKYGPWSTGKSFLLDDLQKLTGQEKGSIFGNPGIRAVKELPDSGVEDAAYWQNEQHWDSKNKVFGPLDFADFFSDPNGPMGKAADGKPIGLDPDAWR